MGNSRIGLLPSCLACVVNQEYLGSSDETSRQAPYTSYYSNGICGVLQLFLSVTVLCKKSRLWYFYIVRQVNTRPVFILKMKPETVKIALEKLAYLIPSDVIMALIGCYIVSDLHSIAVNSCLIHIPALELKYEICQLHLPLFVGLTGKVVKLTGVFLSQAIEMWLST